MLISKGDIEWLPAGNSVNRRRLQGKPTKVKEADYTSWNLFVMSITKHWLEGLPFARALKRQIDRETLIDLLGIVAYECSRREKLEDAGFQDQASSVECLFDYVLDSLHVPPEGPEFSREPFEKLFYNDYLLECNYSSIAEVISALEQLTESIKINMAVSSENAEIRRASFRVVDAENAP